ncbi:MAG TPA: hypothetical protein VJT84_04790, partial [Gaiellaceae bacterium]|nr:hypothetical protein [Gaiellaceae bacterium]
MRRLVVGLAALVTVGLVAVLVTAVGASANTGSATVDCSGAVFSYSQFANEPLPIVVHEQVLIDGQIVAAKDVTV